jgi:hypothetical protein
MDTYEKIEQVERLKAEILENIKKELDTLNSYEKISTGAAAIYYNDTMTPSIKTLKRIYEKIKEIKK